MNNETDLEIYLLSLINSLVIDGNLSEDYEELLENMTILLSDNPELYEFINKSKFLTYQFVICLRNDESCNDILKFVTQNFENLIFPDLFFTKKFIYFLTDKLYEKMYLNYNPILEFIAKFVVRHESILNLLYDCGFFCLLNGIIDIRTCKIYNEIFKNRIWLEKADEKISAKNKDCFYEVHRKQFDSEIIFNENDLIKFKTFAPFKQGTIIHNKIYENLAQTSMYNLIVCDFNEMGSVINYKKDNFEFITENEDLILGCYEKKALYLRNTRNYYKNFKELEDCGFYKKISKFLDDKDFHIRYEVLLTLSLHEDLSINFNEKRIRRIFEILEYKIAECIKCDEGECDGECTLLSILDMLHKIYTKGNKSYFYKISYIILLREISKRIGHIFIAEYFRDVVIYFRSRKNNISRVLFPYQTKRGSKGNLPVHQSANVENGLFDDNTNLSDSGSELSWDEEGNIDVTNSDVTNNNINNDDVNNNDVTKNDINHNDID